MRLFLAWLLALLALAATPALAELPPRPEGPVLDQAGIIPDAQESALDQKLRDYNKATGRAVIIATLGSLDGLDDSEYAQKLAETWDIGGAESEEGVLFLIAPNERKLRIHTGRGVQDRITDAYSGRVIRETVVPRFKVNDYGGGIVAGVDAIIAQLNRSPADAKAVAEAAQAARQASSQGNGGEEGSFVFWLFLIVFFWLLFARKGRRGRRSGIDPGIVLWGVSEAMHHMGGRSSGSGWSGGGGFGGGGFGGFGGGGSGFDGGGASGDW